MGVKRIFRKLLISMVSLLVILVFNFALPRLMPGDTVLMLVGMDEERVTEHEYEYYLEKTGVGRPMAVQFWEYLTGIFKGDLGYSYHHKKEIGQLIAQRLPATLQIAVPAVIISAIFALVSGCVMGMKKGRLPEHLMTGFQIAADGIPSFLLGLLLLSLFAVKLGWLPFGALNSIRVPPGAAAAWGDRVRHLILPVMTLVLGTVPSKYLMICSMVAREKKEKYVLYARSRGLSELRIVFRHILPNVCQPFAAMVGMSMGFVVSGALVIETIFSIKGMGSLISQAVSARDYPVLQGCLFVSAVIIVLANLLTDLICLLLDPKVRCRVHEVE